MSAELDYDVKDLPNNESVVIQVLHEKRLFGKGDAIEEKLSVSQLHCLSVTKQVIVLISIISVSYLDVISPTFHYT